MTRFHEPSGNSRMIWVIWRTAVHARNKRITQLGFVNDTAGASSTLDQNECASKQDQLKRGRLAESGVSDEVISNEWDPQARLKTVRQ
jgi:hypothetical protein